MGRWFFDRAQERYADMWLAMLEGRYGDAAILTNAMAANLACSALATTVERAVLRALQPSPGAADPSPATRASSPA